MEATVPEHVLTYVEAAELLGVHRNTIVNMVRRNELQTIGQGKARKITAASMRRALGLDETSSNGAA
jgi:excisionase family DNA binding protein